MTTDYNDRIEQAAADSADVIDNLTALLRRLGTLAEKAGVERPGYLAPADLVAAISARVDILNAKAAAHNATLADALRTIGYNDTEIEQCLADVPDLTMADIDYARTFAAEVWDESRATYSYGNYVRDAQLRIMPKVDYSAVTQAVAIFQGLTNIEYFPTLDWPNVTLANYVFHQLKKLRRIPQVNAPNATQIAALYANHGSVRSLPAVISHPKATNVANLFNGATHEALATIQTLDLNYGIITNAAQIYVDSGVDTFMLTEFTAPVKLFHAYWTQADYGYISNIKGDQSGTKWNIPHVTDISGAFYSCNATAIDVSGIKTAECTSFDSVFNNTANLRSLDVSMWDVSAGESMQWVFSDSGVEVLNFSHKRFKEGANLVSLCVDMPRLRELILTDVDFTNTADQTDIDAYFYNLPSLETIIGPVTGLHNVVYLADSPLLTVESAMVIINGLADITGSGRALGLYLHASAYNRLTPEQIAVATSKGWLVVKNA
jgi:hypothetical protein